MARRDDHPLCSGIRRLRRAIRAIVLARPAVAVPRFSMLASRRRRPLHFGQADMARRSEATSTLVDVMASAQQMGPGGGRPGQEQRAVEEPAQVLVAEDKKGEPRRRSSQKNHDRNGPANQ